MSDPTPILTDASVLRARMRTKAVNAVAAALPIQLRSGTLEVKDLKVHEREFSPNEQYSALMREGTLHEPLKGTLVLKDKDGAVVDTAKNFTLAHIPYLTERHTLIMGGNEYQVANQLRRKPGVYVARADNGELRSVFNLGRGSNFNLGFTPDKGTFHIQLGTSNIPLYPVLRAVGVSHETIAHHLGEGVANANRALHGKQEEQATGKLYTKLEHPALLNPALSHAEKAEVIRKKWDLTTLDPHVTESTLGTAFHKVSPEALLTAAKKTLAVHAGTAPTDDTDALTFKTFHSIDDFLPERIKLTARAWAPKVKLALATKTNIREALRPAPFSEGIKRFITTGSLAAVPTAINPLELIDHAVKVTSLGEGGIPSERAIPLDARMIHNTHFGALDPIRTPECLSGDAEVFTAHGWKRWDAVTQHDELACRVAGRLEFHRPIKLHCGPYDGLLYGVRAGKLEYKVTANHRVYCAPLDRVYPARPNTEEAFEFYRAEEAHGKPRVFDTAHDPFIGGGLPEFELPRIERFPRNVGPINMEDWASFMGWYLAEGCTSKGANGKPYRTHISQTAAVNPTKCDMLAALLTRLPFKWTRDAKCFHITHRQLATYLEGFGFCYDKYIPEYFFTASVRSRRNLLEALLLGDGRVYSRRASGRSYRQEVFTTTSPRLAVDVERLGISLGRAVRTRRYADKREARYLDVYEVRLLRARYRQAVPRKGHYFIEPYNGLVYCATVPGGLLYVRQGEGIGHWTGNSNHSGVDIRATIAAHRDEHGNLYTVAKNVRTGKEDFLKAGDLAKYVVAFPGETLKGTVDAFVNGKVERVAASRVTHQIAHTSHLYSPATSLLPMIHAMQGNRAIMASKMGTQALPLLEREAPFVQSKSHLPGEVSFEAMYGHMIAPRAPVSGKIVKIEDGWIHIKPDAEHAKKAEDRPTVKTRTFHGLTVHVELAKGSKPFGRVFLNDYGYLPGYTGPDGDSLDVWVGTDESALPVSYDTEEKNTKGVWVKRDTKYILGVPADDVEKVRAQIEQKPDTRCVAKRTYSSVSAFKASLGKFEDEDDLVEKTAATAATDGIVKVPFSQNFPFPSKTSLHHTLDVKVGDKVVAGQRLGDSNYTKDGVLALGRNLRVAYTPYYGLNSNDAVVISEGCAKKLTSEHVYREVFTIPVGMEFSLERHKHYYGTKYTPAQYAVLDSHGVVKKGARVQPKDLLVCGLVKTNIIGTDLILGRISKALAKPFQEVALVWNHGTPGEVIDVVRTGSQIAVLVKTHEQMQVGDKLSGRHGNKGVVAKIVPDPEMLQDAKGRPIDLLLTSAGVISRCYDAETEFLTARGWVLGREVNPSDTLLTFDPDTHTLNWSPQRANMFVQHYKGDIFNYESLTVSLAVTPGHTMYARPAKTHAKGGPQWRVTDVDRLYAHDWEIPHIAPLDNDVERSTSFSIPALPRGSVKNVSDHSKPINVSAPLWAAFLGWFLAEGHVHVDEKNHIYKTHISQSWKANPDKVERIRTLLSQLPFVFRYQPSIFGFVLSGKQLAVYLSQFGYAREKHVPEWLFQQPKAIREIFLDALWAGDGANHVQADGRHAKTIGLTSERLIDDVQRLLYMNGVASVKHTIKVKDSGRHRPMWRCGVHVKSAPARLLEKHNWSKHPYDGLVYCPSVPTGFVVTRRRGKIVIAGNTNPSQVLETALGKIVEKTGKPIVFDNNTPRNLEAWVTSQMKAHGVKDKEHLYDPVLKRKIVGTDGEGVNVGRQFIYKLFKSTDTNFAGHGVGPYDLNEQPLKTGGEDSAKGIGKMEFDALIAHNARNFLHEASTIKGQKNDEFWRAVQLGLPLPAAKAPFAFKKFVGMLEGAGLKVDQRGSKFRLLPMTDKDILARSTGAVTKPETLIAKNLRPEAGGLFDPRLTGGPQGTLYSHLELHEPIPHPVFKEPVRRLLGLTEKGFDEKLQTHGGAWFHKELKALDPKQKLADLHARLKTAKGADLNDTVKQIKYLNALGEHGYTPHDAYIVSKVPVIPPVFRPILPQPNNPSELMVADANKLYMHLMDSTHTLKNTAIESDLGKHRKQVFNAVAALYGTEDVENDELRGQSVKGFLSNIAGVGTPKGGFFQRKVVRKTQDVSGRGTAVPDPTLGMDQVGIPEQMLWQMYDKLIIARMMRQGHSALEAKEAVQKKTPAAKTALMAEVGERPVLINRAPTLHRWSVVAAYPTPVQGKTLRVNPFVERGLNLDYDGDNQDSSVILVLTDPKNYLYHSQGLLLDFDIDGATLVLPSGLRLTRLETTMTARFKTMIPALQNAELALVDLANFPHGEVRAQKEHITFYDVPENVSILAFDETTGQVTVKHPTLWSIHKGRERYIITLTSDRQIFSDDDPRAVYGMDSELNYIRRRPADSVGVFVPVSYGSVPTGEGETLRELPALPGLPALPLIPETGHLIGTLVGNGWTDRYHICLAGMDQGLQDGFKADIAAIFPDLDFNYHVYEHDASTGFGDSAQIRASINGIHFGNRFAGLFGSGAENKHLPTWFLSATQEFRLALLAGLIDTDGSIAVSGAKKKPQWLINYSTRSGRLAREIVLLAQSLKVRAKVTTTTTPAGLPFYVVNFSTVEMASLTGLPLVNSVKRSRFAEFLKDPPEANSSYNATNLLPVPKAVAKRCSRLFVTNSTGYTKWYKSSSTGYVSRAFAEETLTLHPDLRTIDDPLLQRWIALVDNTSVRWDRVVSFERTGIKEDGYDLTVPGHETFMNVEGVILSNTLQVHAPVTHAAIEDAKRMTLSNMLLADHTRNKILAFPQHEAIIGFTHASKLAPSNKPVRKFKSIEEAMAAYKRGELAANDPIELS